MAPPLPAPKPTYSTSSTSLSVFGDTTPDPDLVVGFGMIAAAVSPYALSLVFEDFLFKKFFLPLYDDTEEGRAAEVGWKTRYATLALALTTLAAAEVLWNPSRDIVETLRDSYIVWAIFYTEAIRKIRQEALDGVLVKENRVGIQVWHALVVLVLWADVTTSPVGERITDFIKDVFT